MRTVFLTGVTGFIGWKLSGLLIQQGNKVLTLVRKSDAKLPQACMPVLGYLEDPESVAEAVARCDIVIHLGAIVGNAACDADVEKAVGVNVNGTLNILNGVRFH